MYAGVASGVTYGSEETRVGFHRRWKWMNEQAQKLIETYWESIEAIARRLLEQRELGEDELIAIFEASGGRPWTPDEFERNPTAS
jgi:hypothetical protein